MELRIVNPDPRYAPPTFVAPPQMGYVHVGATVAPSTRPLVRRNGGQEALIAQLRPLAEDISRLPEVERVSLYRAILIPPVDGSASHPARYDVAALIETRSVGVLDRTFAAKAVRDLVGALGTAASDLHVMAARCARCIGPVDRRPDGLYLFNHFEGEDAELAMALWEHLAGWYVAETSLANSTLLAPTGSSDYVLVNHARWDSSVPRLAVAQFSKRTFRSYVQVNLLAHHVIAMPALYRLGWTSAPDPTSRMS